MKLYTHRLSCAAQQWLDGSPALPGGATPYRVHKGKILRSVSLRILVAAATLALSTLGAPIAHAQAQPAPAAPAAASQPSAAPTASATVAPASGQPAAAKPADSTDNPYGIEALWKSSDIIARSVLILLAIMSAGSWNILVTKLLEQTRLRRAARSAQTKFWQAGTLRDGVNSLEKNSAYRFIADSG